MTIYFFFINAIPVTVANYGYRKFMPIIFKFTDCPITTIRFK